MIAWGFVAVLLTVWAFLGFALARRAEARATLARAPHPWFAIAGATTVGLLALISNPTPAAAAACGFASIGLVAAADSDARSGYLFDAVTLPTAVLTSLAVLVAGSTREAACGVTILVATFGSFVLISRGSAMGLGDVKAMFSIGMAFGPLESLVAIFAACVSGIIVSLIRRRFRRGARLHFGPHLAAGCATALVAENHTLRLWIGL